MNIGDVVRSRYGTLARITRDHGKGVFSAEVLEADVARWPKGTVVCYTRDFIELVSKALPEEPCTPDCTDCVNVGACLSEAGTGNEPTTAEILREGSERGYLAAMRKFETGATRNVDDDNHDYEGFLSPLVIKRFGEYMHGHRKQADGTIRASDNWQKGIPFDSYMKSGWRHFVDWWCGHRKVESRDDLETALCALLFNVQGYLHELLKKELEDSAETD